MSVAPPQDAGEAVLDQFADQNFFDVMEKMEYNDLLTLSQKLKLDTSGEKYDLVGMLLEKFVSWTRLLRVTTSLRSMQWKIHYFHFQDGSWCASRTLMKKL